MSSSVRSLLRSFVFAQPLVSSSDVMSVLDETSSALPRSRGTSSAPSGRECTDVNVTSLPTQRMRRNSRASNAQG